MTELDKLIQDVKTIVHPLSRQFAVMHLGETRDPRAIEPLIALLRDADANIRAAAAEQLGKFSETSLVEPLMTALKDRRWEVRRAAAAALGGFGDRQSVRPLISLLQDPSRDVRDAAEAALVRLGTVAVPELLMPLMALREDTVGIDQDSGARARVARVLGCIKDGAAVEHLMKCLLLDHDQYNRRVYMYALVDLGDTRALEVLIDILDKE